MVHPERAREMIDLCPAFRGLTVEAKRALSRHCREAEFFPEEQIASITEPLQSILIVIEGRAKLVGLTDDGVERILYVYHPGEVIGSRILLPDSTESPFEVVAMGGVRAAAIPKREFMAVVREHPEILASLTKTLHHRLDRLARGMLAAMSTDATMRLAKLLFDFAADHEPPPGQFVPLKYSLTHETMAQMIGASRPHTTALLRNLEASGVVLRDRPRGVRVSPARLKALLGEEAAEGTRQVS